MTEDQTMKIADFGLTRNVQDGYYRKTTDVSFMIPFHQASLRSTFVFYNLDETGKKQDR